MTDTFTDNTTAHRFELDVDGHIAFANYRRSADALAILHVEAPIHLRGTGAASRLMQHIADTASQGRIGLVPYCSYARAWVQRRGG